MHEEFKKIEESVQHVKEYLNTRLSYAKLNAADKSASMISALLARVFVGLVFLLSILFASAAAAYGLASYIGKTWVGFLLVSGVYLLAGICIWASRNRLLRIPIMNAILKYLYYNDSKHHEEN